MFGGGVGVDGVRAVWGLLGKRSGRGRGRGSRGGVAGLSLTAERMAGRRNRIDTVIVRRLADTRKRQTLNGKTANGKTANGKTANGKNLREEAS